MFAYRKFEFLGAKQEMVKPSWWWWRSRNMIDMYIVIYKKILANLIMQEKEEEVRGYGSHNLNVN